MRMQHWRIVLGAMAMAILPGVAAAQGLRITGRVQGSAGEPTPGAAVALEGLGIGATVGPDGRYSITVPEARVNGQTVTITARAIGFTALTRRIVLTGSEMTQDFALVSAPLRLSEIVVTGSGTETTREKLGNVVNTVSGAAIARSASTNLVSALSGKAPNVEIHTQSGDPGSSASIRIRGYTTILGTSQPLFIVDGTPIDNSTSPTTASTGGTVASNRAADINDDDIASIQILKGSAAAAIYGARAANGVVLITTKSGQAGPTRYSFKSEMNTDQVIKFEALQHQFGQGVNGKAAVCGGLGCNMTSVSYGAPITGTWYDHSRDMLHDGHTYDNDLQISGGDQRTTFFLSAGETDQNGVVIGPNNYYNRTSVRLKATHALNSSLHIGGNADYVDSRGAYVQRGSNVSGLLLGGYRTPADFNNFPYLDPTFHLQRSYRYPRPTGTSQTVGRGYDNPLFVAYNNGAQSELGRFIGNTNVDWAPNTWFALKENFGIDSYSDYRLEALPQSSSGSPTGQVTRTDNFYLGLDNNLLVTLTKHLSGSDEAQLVVGQELNSRRDRFNSNTGLNLVAPQPFSLQNTTSSSPSENRSLRHIEGYFAQGSLDLFNQLYLTAGVRNDGYSTFGASNRTANYPKASIAWNVTNFMGNTNQTGLLSYFKLRAAYGETGNEPPVYADATGYSLGQGFYGSGYGDGLNATQQGRAGLVTNPTEGGGKTLKPERTKESEIGTDLAFFDQKIELGLTYYDKKSTQIILALPQAPDATGFYSAIMNGAQINNQGTELTFAGHPINNRDLGWDIGVNWAHNQNMVVDLSGVQFVSRAGGSFSGAYGTVTKGYPVGVLRGQDFAICGRGLVLNGVNIDQACGANSNGALYIGANGLPVVDPTDRVIADPNAKWTGSVSTTLRVGRNLRFNGLLDIKHGGQAWDGTKGALYYFGTAAGTAVRGQSVTYGKDYFTQQYPRVAGPGAGTSFVVGQSWWTGQGGGFGSVSAQFMEPAGYAKLRELGVTYTLDQPWVSRDLGLSSIDVHFAGQNLKTWTKYGGTDPEANLGGAAVLVQGIDYFGLPGIRSFVLSLTLNR
ncbi:MAG: SusC/RagA family TonB-linked outer membrane protein [Gemmatimonadaceae bacterium]